MEFEEFVPEFGKWYSQGERCACFVGIRTDESLNRFRTIVQSKKEMLDGVRWTSRVIDEVYNVYPIYDWHSLDLWTYHGKNPDRPYNRLYDLMHKAGVPMGHMRICQPYGDDQRRGLWLFHLIEPETWSRVVARVNGANGGSLYVQEWGNINGYRGITKPAGHTWRTFADLLVNSMPPPTQLHYQNKIILFNRWWKERGYPDGIPDEAAYEMEAARRAPSWRRVCKSLLRNDWWCKGMGFSQQKSDAYRKYLALMERRKQEWRQQQELAFEVSA
jgi:predicted phosphoadenosine phosphosulfate sulfurtransferase